MKKTSLFFFFFCLFSAVIYGGGCFAADSTSVSELQSDTEAGEIRGLTASIELLAKLLEERSIVENKERNLDMAISYLSFRSRRIEAVEDDLSDAKRSKERLDDLVREWSLREEAIENEIRNDPQGGGKELEQSMKEVRHRKRSMEQRIARTESEIVLLENRKAELQSQIDSVESYVQRNLAL